MRIATAFFLLVGSQFAFAGGCVESATQACLLADRFAVTIDYDIDGANFAPSAAAPTSGPANRIALDAENALFSFYDAEQADALVRVIDGCMIDDHIWVFAAAPTDAEVTINVTDTVSGQARTYFSGAGFPTPPITDTGAFAVCPIAAKGNSPASTSKGGCTGLFCLQSGRFQLDIDYRDFDANTGSGTSLFATDHSGVAALFGTNDPSTISTVIDGLADNDSFWFLTSAVSSVEINYRLTDTQTGLVNTYTQPFGMFRTILDRGGSLTSSLTGISAAAGQSAVFELVIENTTAAARMFDASIDTPAGASNPSFICTAESGATCPTAAGDGAFAENGAIPANGRLRYRYQVDLPLTAIGTTITTDAEVTTAAHALAGPKSDTLSDTIDVLECADVGLLEVIPALALDGAGSLVARTGSTRAFVQTGALPDSFEIAFTADFSCTAALATTRVSVLALLNPQSGERVSLDVHSADVLFAAGMESRQAQIIPSTQPPGRMEVLYRFDRSDGTVSLSVNQQIVTAGQTPGLVSAPPFTTLRLGNPGVIRPGAGGLTVFDNFSLTETGQPMPQFADDFESGDLSRWDSAVP